jgi:chemotaxis protein MotD
MSVSSVSKVQPQELALPAPALNSNGRGRPFADLLDRAEGPHPHQARVKGAKHAEHPGRSEEARSRSDRAARPPDARNAERSGHCREGNSAEAEIDERQMQCGRADETCHADKGDAPQAGSGEAAGADNESPAAVTGPEADTTEISGTPAVETVSDITESSSDAIVDADTPPADLAKSTIPAGTVAPAHAPAIETAASLPLAAGSADGSIEAEALPAGGTAEDRLLQSQPATSTPRAMPDSGASGLTAVPRGSAANSAAASIEGNPVLQTDIESVVSGHGKDRAVDGKAAPAQALPAAPLRSTAPTTFDAPVITDADAQPQSQQPAGSAQADSVKPQQAPGRAQEQINLPQPQADTSAPRVQINAPPQAITTEPVRALANSFNPVAFQAVREAVPNPVPFTNAALAVEIVSRMRDGLKRFDIRLDPPELGRVDVRLEVDRNGHVATKLMVEKPETLDLLQREARGLERALQQAGLKTDQGGLEFTLRQQADDGAGSRQGSSVPRPDLLVADESERLEAVIEGYRSVALARGGVDIRI